MGVIMLASAIVGAAVGATFGIIVLRLHGRLKHVEDEIVELHAVVDTIFIGHGQPSVFAARYDLTEVIDPTKLPPPGAP